MSASAKQKTSASGKQKTYTRIGGVMRPAVVHQRLWLAVCVWCLLCWTASAQASWEAYQRAGEAAYSRGHYTEAERMFLAAVREARYFGPQDPRLDISLNKLALLRVIRGQHATAQKTARQGRVSRRSRQRPQPRTALQRVRPGRHKQALWSGRPGEHRKGVRPSISRPAHRSKPHAGQPRRVQL
jgi:hypothetical protein